jgi:hypothetical protein
MSQQNDGSCGGIVSISILIMRRKIIPVACQHGFATSSHKANGVVIFGYYSRRRRLMIMIFDPFWFLLCNGQCERNQPALSKQQQHRQTNYALSL